MILKIDCKYFPGDRPCEHHKESGVKCPECPHYKSLKIPHFNPSLITREGEKRSGKKNKDMLIIKTGAPGDVLRTTPLLSGLREKYGGEKIYWLTDRKSLELLKDNPFLYRIMTPESRLFKEIKKKEFAFVINPENSKRSALIAETIHADQKFGYGFRPEGYIYPYTKEAEYYLEMAGFDDVKKANRKTYQEILFEMCGMRFSPERNKILTPPLIDRKFIKSFRGRYRIETPVIGLHTGAGRRWQLKKWRTDSFAELAGVLAGEGNTVVLLGGNLEAKTNREIKRKVNAPNVIDGTVNDDFKKFVNTIYMCDLIVCGDTLALHLALGFQKKVVALFGPTSPWEIELYGLGVKIFPEIDCICCYRGKCNKKPNCMDLISVDRVYDAVIKLIN